MSSSGRSEKRSNTKRKLQRAIQQLGRVTVNKVVRALVRWGISLPPITPRTVIVVATVGRKSGKRRETPMGYVRAGEDRILVVSEHGIRSDWFRNARAAGSVVVWVGRRRFRATVRVLADEDPGRVLRRMRSRLVAASNRLLWNSPKVVEIRLGNEAR